MSFRVDDGVRIIVIGGGVVGLAAALAASRRGASVLCLEANEVGNTNASSAGAAKIFRFAYSRMFFAKLMVDAEVRWREYEETTGDQLIHRCGGLNIAPPSSVRIQGIVRSLSELQRTFDIMLPNDPRLSELGVHVNDHEIAVLEHGAGIFKPADVLVSLARRARAVGVDLREYVCAEAIESIASGVLVRTSAGPIRADRAIVATGPQLPHLIPEIAKDLTITRQYQSIFKTERIIGNGATAAWADIALDEPYGVINLPGNVHIVGDHVSGEIADPASPPDIETTNKVSSSHLETLIARCRGISRATLVETRICHYSSTESRDFLVRPARDAPNVILLSACSGHGFKFALNSGDQAAALAIES